MNQTEKLLIGIENTLEIANEIVGEIEKLREIKEQFIMMKEQCFFHQLNRSEREVFSCAIDGLSARETAEFLYKEFNTVKKQRQMIRKKLNVNTMKEAVELYEKEIKSMKFNSKLFDEVV